MFRFCKSFERLVYKIVIFFLRGIKVNIMLKGFVGSKWIWYFVVEYVGILLSYDKNVCRLEREIIVLMYLIFDFLWVWVRKEYGLILNLKNYSFGRMFLVVWYYLLK